MVRDAFELAKEKCKERNGAIIFIDEVRAACFAVLLPYCTVPAKAFSSVTTH